MRAGRGFLTRPSPRPARSTELAIETAEPKVSTSDAKKMGIVGTVASYTTLFGGVANRIHNVASSSRA